MVKLFRLVPSQGGALRRRRESSGRRYRLREAPPAQNRAEAVRGLRQQGRGIPGKSRTKPMGAFCMHLQQETPVRVIDRRYMWIYTT